MIIGSDNGTTHVIENVVFDFLFDSGNLEQAHESLLSTWVVDELLPTIEAALNAYGETDKILRIEQLTVDLGDIPDSDYSTQIIQRLYEQLVIQLNNASYLGKSIAPTSQQRLLPAIRKQTMPSADELSVQQTSQLQSDLEILEHFLMTGAMPWYINTTDSSAHEKLLGRVLAANERDALYALLAKIPSTKRSAFARRMANQYATKNLEALLIQIVPGQHELILGFINAYRSVLSTLSLSALQQTSATKMFWERIFSAIIHNTQALEPFNFPKVLPQILHELAASVPLDQDVLMNKLIHASASHTQDIKAILLSMTLTDQNSKQAPAWRLLLHSKETKAAADPKSVKDSYFLTAGAIPETSHRQPYTALLYRQIYAALRQSGIDETGLKLEHLQSAIPPVIQKQLFEILQDKAVRTQLISRVTPYILLDITYLLSSHAAIILEQLLSHAEILHRQTLSGRQSTVAEWKHQLLENAFSFLVTARLNRSFDAIGFVQALAFMSPDDREGSIVLNNWRQVLIDAQGREQEQSALQNLLLDAITVSEPKQQELLTIQEIGLISTALETNFKQARQRLKTAIGTGSVALGKLSETETKHIIQALLDHDPSMTAISRQIFLEAIEAHAWKAADNALYYQMILEKLLHGQTIDLETIVASAADAGNRIPAKTELAEPPAVQSTHSGTDSSAMIYQRIVSALQQSDIAGPRLPFDASRAVDGQTIRTQLLELLRKKAVRLQLIDKLPQSMLIDITYLLSPQAAMVLEQLIVNAERLNPQLISFKHSAPAVWQKQLLESALDSLVMSSAEHLSTKSFEVSEFLYETAYGLSDEDEIKPALQFWHDELQQHDHKKRIGTGVLRNIILDAISTPLSVSGDNSTGQEIKRLTTELASDFKVQQQRIRLAIESNKLVLEELSEDELKHIVQALLKHDPALADGNRETFAEAIEAHALKTANRVFYYRQVLARLLAGEIIDLEEIISYIAQHNLPRTDRDISIQTNSADQTTPAQRIKTSTDIYQRILTALKQVTQTGTDLLLAQLQTADIPSIKKQFAKSLQNEAWRTQLITQLPPSVLLDISYVLSPQAAILLEHLMLHSEALFRETENTHNTDVVDVTRWENQVWKNALRYLVDDTSPYRLFGNSFVATDFFRALAYRLSDHYDPLVLLKRWREALMQQQVQAGTVLQNMILDVISSTQAVQKDYWNDEKISQIVTALATDFKREQQRLRTAFLHDLHFSGQLSETGLKRIVEALLKHDPALTGGGRETFAEAVEMHAWRAGSKAAYYRDILEKLLLKQVIDLETIVSQSADAGDPVHTHTRTEAAKKPSVNRSLKARAIICQRIHSALQQSGMTEIDLFLAQFSAADTQAIQQQLPELLQNKALRTWLIARLPESILVDITYILSPQAALMIEQLLFNAEMLFQYTPKKHAVTVTAWKQHLWENSFSYLVDLPAADASVDRLNPLTFIHALINKISGDKNDFTAIQSWHNVLIQMQGIEYGHDHGTRILRHIVETLLRQQIPDPHRRAGQSFRPQPLMLKTDKSTPVEFITPHQTDLQDYNDRDGDEFYIHNAGQVLAAPYLPRLFSFLGLINKGVFNDRSAAERAVHLLQFMVNEETQSPEYQLLLNKLLCGLSTAIPISNGVEISQHEQETIENLIQGMIQNWKTIGNTSIQGLRETFLQRNGRLLLKDEMWFLTIEPGPFDMLLDQLPWSFSVIKHSWMERAIHVTWR